LRKFGFKLVEPVGATGAQRQVPPLGGERAGHSGAQAGTRTGDENLLPSHPRSIAAIVSAAEPGAAGRRPQHSYFSKRDIRRSASTLPPVWQVGQY
jgi:hypothetical protein